MPMVRNWLKQVCQHTVWSGAVLLAIAGSGRAQDLGQVPAPAAGSDVQAKLEAQQREIDELKRLIQSAGVRPTSADAADGKLDDAAVKKIIDGYLSEKEKKKKDEEAAAKQKLDDEGFK